MASIGELVISLRADIAQFRSGMDQANQSLKQVEEQASSASATLQVLKDVFEGFLSYASVQQVLDFAKGLVENAAQIEHVTQALGVNAQQFQEQQFAFRQAGVDADVFGTSMEKLAKNIDLVALGVGSKQLVEVFSRLGLAATNADGTLRSTGDLLDDLAKNKIFQAESETKKLADYMLLTGARGGEAALGVNALGASFEQSKADALAFNQVLSQDTIDTLTKLKEQLETDAIAVRNFFATVLAEAVKANNGPNLYTLTNGLIGVAPDQGAQNAPKPPTADKPAGPSVPSGGFAAQAKELQSFKDEYAKLIQTYQDDLNYQSRLRDAYQQSAAAVRELEIEHAGEEAAEKAIAAAQHDHVAISTQEIAAVYSLAAASKQASIAAEEQKQVTDALANAEKEHAAKVQEVLNATDGLTKKNNELADALGILQQAYQQGIIPTLAEYQQRVQAAQQIYSQASNDSKQAATQIAGAVERGASAFLDAATNMQKGTSAMQEFQNVANGLTKDIEKLILQLLILDPLKKALTSGLSGGFGSLFGGGAAAAGSASLETPAFANGGDFVVGGIGGTDSQLVQFRATPGEKVSINAHPGREGNAPAQIVHQQVYSPTFITPNADSFKKTSAQHGADAMRQMKNAGRYV